MIDIRILRAGLYLAIACTISGCATPSGHGRVTDASFPDALHACRALQPGRAIRKYSLPATHPNIARCLKPRGWNSDGTRTTPQ